MTFERIDKIASMIDMTTVLDGMKHVMKLADHGAKILDHRTGKLRKLDLKDFYWGMKLLHEANGLSVDFEMKIPETEEKMLLRIWKNGHVDSGNYETMTKMLD